MERLTFDLSKRGGSFKPMNAVNGGGPGTGGIPMISGEAILRNTRRHGSLIPEIMIPFCAVPYTGGPMLMILRLFSRILTRILMILHPMILIVRMKRS